MHHNITDFTYFGLGLLIIFGTVLVGLVAGQFTYRRGGFSKLLGFFGAPLALIISFKMRHLPDSGWLVLFYFGGAAYAWYSAGSHPRSTKQALEADLGTSKTGAAGFGVAHGRYRERHQE